MKILLVGGGSVGSIAPLLAVKRYLEKHNHKIQFIYFGSKSGPERELVEKEEIAYYSIPAGKWRRYFSLKNIFDVFVTLTGFFIALAKLKRLRPDLMLSAGSFVSVPVAIASKLLGIKIVIHQQDLRPSLSNKIIYPFCDKLTVSLPESQKLFFQGLGLLKRRSKAISKIVLTGNPVRVDLAHGDKKRAIKLFSLNTELPVLLVLGGSTGAEGLNKLIVGALEPLTKVFQIIHVTGKNKTLKTAQNSNYHAFEFLSSEFPDAMKIADIVLSRAGFSTITELAYCKKMSVIIPMPNSHQEDNGQYLFSKRAAIILKQDGVTPENLTTFLRKLIFEYNLQKIVTKNISELMPKNSAERIGKVILNS